jgi:hypothetical protein
MSLAVGEHCESIVGRIDESATNGLVGNGVDHGAANDSLLIRLPLARSSLRADAAKRDKRDENQHPGLDCGMKGSPIKLALDGRSFGGSQENHSDLLLPYAVRFSGDNAII